ncbi:hypothetical protein AVT69_gp246 [Pseudomonas phage PhiPA3]|uniref:Uncharacterized protein 248 n=1 Tax=Pseudomonas phage PhiPA3 TaxID=998086 RepID=F8SJ90_BPPA3|nr:hypothetical protein AVT69_gp246 [Pseudomonas phage PhiPA3]AEH03671.1 hypothetical protein [Pseudomonas phage PhiPA3]
MINPAHHPLAPVTSHKLFDIFRKCAETSKGRWRNLQESKGYISLTIPHQDYNAYFWELISLYKCRIVHTHSVNEQFIDIVISKESE